MLNLEPSEPIEPSELSELRVVRVDRRKSSHSGYLQRKELL